MRNSLTKAIVFLSLASGILVATPAKAEQRLGGLDLATYCDNVTREIYGTKYIASKAWAEDPKNAYSWQCAMFARVKPNTDAAADQRGFHMNQVCQVQYQNERAYSRVGNEKDAYSWSCYLP
jgi:hypothetical protein